jgi:hypothetical protein
MSNEKRGGRRIGVTASPRVSIVILNWNNWEDTLECLDSVFTVQYPAFDVVLLDNGSHNSSLSKISGYLDSQFHRGSEYVDVLSGNAQFNIVEYSGRTPDMAEGSARDFVRDPCPKMIALIGAGSNFGFAEGNNIGIRYALKRCSPEYILLLNNDAVVEHRLLSSLVSLGERDGSIGMIGPKICRYIEPQEVWAVGGRVNLFTGKAGNNGCGAPSRDYRGVVEVDYATGCCLLVKRDLVVEVGLLDPSYFCYFEDSDWALRSRIQGFRSVIDCDTVILHKGGGSINTSSGRLYYYHYRNRLLFMRKNGEWYHMVTFAISFIFSFMSTYLYNSAKKNTSVCRNLERALIDFARGRFGCHDDVSDR